MCIVVHENDSIISRQKGILVSYHNGLPIMEDLAKKLLCFGDFVPESYARTPLQEWTTYLCANTEHL